MRCSSWWITAHTSAAGTTIGALTGGIVAQMASTRAATRSNSVGGGGAGTRSAAIAARIRVPTHDGTSCGSRERPRPGAALDAG